MEIREFAHNTFVNSDILVKAVVDRDGPAIHRLDGIISKLNPLIEKVEISQFVLSDVMNKAIEKGANLTSVYTSIVPGRGIYFDVVYIPDAIVDVARQAMYYNIEYRLTLTDWTALLWMAVNQVPNMLSDKENISKVLEASSNRTLSNPPDNPDIPRIFDDLRNIKRI